MAKPNSRSLKTPAHLDRLVESGLLDLAEFLDDNDRAYLLERDRTHLDVSAFVQRELSDACATDSFRRYAALRQIDALLKKNIDLDGTSAQDRKKTAIGLFHSSERKCKRTNRRLSFYLKYPSRIRKNVREVLTLAQSISYDIFGPLTRLTYHKICERSGFGPGFTFGSDNQESRHLYYKVAGPHTVTSEALPYVKVMLNHSENWKNSLCGEGSTFTRVRGNRITTVPKTAVIDRTIAIEPSLNVFLQKGVDEFLKGRLRHFGVSLKDQGFNHPPARIGSQRPLYAGTVDLSSASDLISVELVRFLLPSLWFTLLDDLRSREYTLDKGKTWHNYEKFSSMGNAFTFPLESIIFYSLAKACTILAGAQQSVLRVYGDDIIIDPCAGLLLYEVLDFVGFSVNREKSFLFGNFRETCGVDYLSGVDVRPVYVKRNPRNDQEAYNLFNRLLRNRVGFKLHNMCNYLYGIVERPLIGPPSLPPGEKYLDWYAGKSVIFDHYFHAPPDKGERFMRFDLDLQRYVWVLKTLHFKPKNLDTSNWSLQLWYLTFLLGLSGTQKVDSVSRFRRVLKHETFVFWDELPWRPWLYD